MKKILFSISLLVLLSSCEINIGKYRRFNKKHYNSEIENKSSIILSSLLSIIIERCNVLDCRISDEEDVNEIKLKVKNPSEIRIVIDSIINELSDSVTYKSGWKRDLEVCDSGLKNVIHYKNYIITFSIDSYKVKINVKLNK